MKEKYAEWKKRNEAEKLELEAQRIENQKKNKIAYEKKQAAHDAKCADPVQQARLKAYLDDLMAVGEKHGLSLCHEDSQGSFLVYEREYDDDDDFTGARWGQER
jgi:hypothetical protein